MKNTLSKIQKTEYALAQLDYLNALATHCDYALTLQTNLLTYGISEATMEQRTDALRSNIHKFRMRLNRLLTGNGYKRNNDYVPIFVVAIEGTKNTYDKNRTLHAHVMIGNLPASATYDLLVDAITQLWLATDVGTEDIRLDRLTVGTEQRWSGYISKETYRGNVDCIDYTNTQIPKKILAEI